jgi:hypothetical protein
VLVLGGTREIPISGTIAAVTDESWTVSLDLLIDDYAHALDEHLSRLMMLDLVLYNPRSRLPASGRPGVSGGTDAGGFGGA